jgi:hypothetical protein
MWKPFIPVGYYDIGASSQMVDTEGFNKKVYHYNFFQRILSRFNVTLKVFFKFLIKLILNSLNSSKWFSFEENLVAGYWVNLIQYSKR